MTCPSTLSDRLRSVHLGDTDMLKFLAWLAVLPAAACADTALTTTAPAGTVTSHAASVPRPPAGEFWVYRNGTFNWGGDYSWCAGRIDYRDTTGKPPSGKFDIAVPIVCAFGGYQPYAALKKFDLSAYKYLTYSLKPTSAGQIFATVFHDINDVPNGTALVTASSGVTTYGPEPQVGVWATYKIPLSDFNLRPCATCGGVVMVQKFTIADGTGSPKNLFYVDNVGFTN
jgi:hypothetical protein